MKITLDDHEANMFKTSTDFEKSKYKSNFFDQYFFSVANEKEKQDEEKRALNKVRQDPTEDKICHAKDLFQQNTTAKYIPSPKAQKGLSFTVNQNPPVGKHEVKYSGIDRKSDRFYISTIGRYDKGLTKFEQDQRIKERKLREYEEQEGGFRNENDNENSIIEMLKEVTTITPMKKSKSEDILKKFPNSKVTKIDIENSPKPKLNINSSIKNFSILESNREVPSQKLMTGRSELFKTEIGLTHEGRFKSVPNINMTREKTVRNISLGTTVRMKTKLTSPRSPVDQDADKQFKKTRNTGFSFGKSDKITSPTFVAKQQLENMQKRIKEMN